MVTRALTSIVLSVTLLLSACADTQAPQTTPESTDFTTDMPFKLDTGAQANLMSEVDYRQLTVKNNLFPARTRVRGYTGEKVPVKGRCVATFEHGGQCLKAQLLIVAQEVQPILGLKACEKLVKTW